MVDTTLANIAAAANDSDLRDRIISAAAEQGIALASQWVEQNSRLLTSLPLTEQGDTIASVYAYAVSQMPPRPGANPAAVTDAYIRAAVQQVLNPPTE